MRGVLITFALVVSIIFLMLVLKVFKLKRGFKAMNVSVLLLIIFGLVASLTVLYLIPYQSLSGSQFTVNLHNYDPLLQYVTVTTSPQESVQVRNGTTVSAVPLTALQTINAVGYSSYGTYNMSTTFNNITSPDLYFTVGGIQTSSTYLPVSINNIGNVVLLYTTDLNGKIVPYINSQNGVTASYVYVGQLLQNSNGEGVIIINSTIKEISIDSSGNIDITSNLNSGSLAFTNSTGTNGVLEHRDPWNINAEWESAVTLSNGSTTSSLVVYVTQEWRLVDTNNNQLSPIASISQTDIQNGTAIVLTGDF